MFEPCLIRLQLADIWFHGLTSQICWVMSQGKHKEDTHFGDPLFSTRTNTHLVSVVHVLHVNHCATNGVSTC